jgi:hypothetical protein
LTYSHIHLFTIHLFTIPHSPIKIFHHQKQNTMQELITRLTQKAGITTEQAATAIETIKDFAKEKFPMMAGAVDNLFSGSGAAASTGAAATGAAATTAAASAATAGGSMMDKISDVIPGETGQKVEDFAKKAADKAEDLYDSAKDKLSGLFGGDKK